MEVLENAKNRELSRKDVGNIQYALERDKVKTHQRGL